MHGEEAIETGLKALTTGVATAEETRLVLEMVYTLGYLEGQHAVQSEADVKLNNVLKLKLKPLASV